MQVCPPRSAYRFGNLLPSVPINGGSVLDLIVVGEVDSHEKGGHMIMAKPEPSKKS